MTTRRRSLRTRLRDGLRLAVFAATPVLGLVFLPLRLLDIVWPANPLSLGVARAVNAMYPRWFHLHAADAAQSDGAEYLAERRLRAETNLARYGVMPLRATRVLEVGCGTGAKTAFYGDVLGARAVGVDVDAEPVMLGAVNGVTERAALIVAPPYVLPFADASFDVVLCEEVLEHVADVSRLVAEIARVLADGGVALILIGPMYLHAKGPHLQEHLRVLWPHVLFSKTTLRRLLATLPEGAELNRHAKVWETFVTLSGHTERVYRNALRGSGLKVERLERVAELPLLAAIPWAGELYRKSLRAVLRKEPAARAAVQPRV